MELWNKFPPCVKSTSCKRFRAYLQTFEWLNTNLIGPIVRTPILYPILMLLFFQNCFQLLWSIHIRNLSPFYHGVVAFMRDLYSRMNVFICFLYIYEFYFVTGHHRRTVWPNGLPRMDITEVKNKIYNSASCSFRFGTSYPGCSILLFRFSPLGQFTLMEA